MNKNNIGILILAFLLMSQYSLTFLNCFLSLPTILVAILQSLCCIVTLAIYLLGIRKIEYKIEYGIILLCIINLLAAISFIHI